MAVNNYFKDQNNLIVHSSVTSLKELKRLIGLDTSQSHSEMEMRSRDLLLGLLILILIIDVHAARGGGYARGRDRGRLYNSRIPIIIPHRTQAEINYYENKDGAKIVKASHFELDYMLGRKITFFCMAQGIPRPEITWFKDGIELYYHRFFQVHEWPLGNDTMKSKMEIDPTTQQDAGYYECQADNQYAIDRRGFRTDYVMITY